MTRSLSNLLKGFYVAVDRSDARVIDSNELISEKLVHIRKTVNTEGFSSEGFSAGLNPLNVSEVLDENSHIIGDEPMGIEEPQIPIDAEAKKEEILNEANEQANVIIGRANEDAMSIIENAKMEAEKILLEAREAGYSEGMQKANMEAEAVTQQVISEYKEKEQKLVAEYRRKAEEIEPELVDVILKIFADITRKSPAKHLWKQSSAIPDFAKITKTGSVHASGFVFCIKKRRRFCALFFLKPRKLC